MKSFEKRSIEVIYFQHDDGPGTGFSIGDEDFEIATQVSPIHGEKVFIKDINSCFGNKEFVDYLKEKFSSRLIKPNLVDAVILRIGIYFS